ncbi:hypothetical protein [Flexithrix dorotheae]|uniref:hypothetical protein n=1 Tax=Flexithrix dorotheae TaxID=70993 RepID=UPI000364E5D8|nr:hypothetical protein [Flexithrix dorotheae]
MRRLIIAAIFLGSFQFSIAQKNQSIKKSKTAPVIDGNISDWEFDWQGDEKLAYTICEHENVFYVRLKPLDETTERKIIMFGLTLMLDGRGKEEGEFGITFPTSNQERMMQYRQNNRQNNANSRQRTRSGAPNEEERAQRQLVIKQKLVETSKEFIISGLTDNPIVGNIENENSGIELALGLDENNMVVYEARIPREVIKIKEKKTGSELAIGFETGFLDVEAMNAARAQKADERRSRAGQNPTAEGAPRTGRPQGGGRNGMNTEELSVPTVVWETVTLE